MYTHIRRLKAFQKNKHSQSHTSDNQGSSWPRLWPTMSSVWRLRMQPVTWREQSTLAAGVDKCRRKKLSKETRITLSHQPPVCFQDQRYQLPQDVTDTANDTTLMISNQVSGMLLKVRRTPQQQLGGTIIHRISVPKPVKRSADDGWTNGLFRKCQWGIFQGHRISNHWNIGYHISILSNFLTELCCETNRNNNPRLRSCSSMPRSCKHKKRHLESLHKKKR